MLTGAQGPVQSFTRDGLPRLTRVAADLQTLIENTNQFVSALRRSPAQAISGQRAPEFRR